MFRSTVGAATRMNIVSRRRTRRDRSHHANRAAKRLTCVRRYKSSADDDQQNERTRVVYTGRCRDATGDGAAAAAADRQTANWAKDDAEATSSRAKPPAVASSLACLPLNQLDHRHDEPHVNHGVTAHRPLPRRDINQSCIFRVVQVIKSLHWRRGIIYRGLVIMSVERVLEQKCF